MRATSLHRGSASAQADAERRPSPRLVVARRIDSARPTRVWSLLLPPRFLIGRPEGFTASSSREDANPVDESRIAVTGRPKPPELPFIR